MRRPQPAGTDRIMGGLALLLVVATLYFARAILIPLVLAVLLTFLLAPVVRRLERVYLPRVLAALLVMGVCVCGVASLGWVLQDQALGFAANLPGYKENLLKKLDALRPARSGVIGGASDAIAELGREITSPLSDGAPGAGTGAGAGPIDRATKPAGAAGPGGRVDTGAVAGDARGAEPLRVKIVEPPLSPVSYAQSLLGPVLGTAASGAIVAVLAMFMLVNREDLRDRVVRLLGARTMHLTTPALDDAAQRLGRYLLLQLLVNVVTGLVVGLGLLLIGVPGAALWGSLVVALRFVPYIGIVIAAAFPLLLSLAVSPDWREPIMVLGLFGVVEALCAQLVEPLVFSSRTGISSTAVLASALFWAWLWGPVGLLLSTPMTVCLVVLGKHIPRLAFLEVLLGDGDALSLEARFYQRLLTGDQEEATQIATEFAKERSLAAVYDQLVLPAMRLAEADRHRGELEDERGESVRELLAIIVEDLGDGGAAGSGAGAAVGAATGRGISAATVAGEDAATTAPARAMCVPARDAMDGLAARMSAQVLEQAGISAEAISAETSTGELLEKISKRLPRAVCISAVPPGADVHARVLCKRLRKRFPELAIVIGVWNTERTAQDAQTRLGGLTATGTEYVVTSLGQAAATLGPLTAQAVAAMQATEAEPAAR